MTLQQKEGALNLVLTVEEVAELVGGRAEGDLSFRVEGIAPLDQARGSELGFLAQRRYLKYLPGCRAQAVLVGEALAWQVQEIPARVVVDDPHAVLPRLLTHFHPPPSHDPGIHPTAVIGTGVELGDGVTLGPYAVLEEGAVLGDGVRIGPHSVVGAGCFIGEGSVLHPHVVLYPGTRLGARVVIHSGVCLGVDGFGYVPGDTGPLKVPQVGACVVEDDVEIGANCCVDRGSIGRTVIGRGTKLDNLVHLGHNVQIGPACLITGQVGIAGSVRVGRGAMFGGQAGVAGHIEIGDGARIGAQAGVIGSIPPGATVSGFPARNNREYLRAMGLAFKLPDTLRKLDGLEARVEALAESLQEGKGTPQED